MNRGFQFALAAVMAVGALQAQASTASYDFSVNWSNGNLAGTTSVGSFSFDASLAVPDGNYQAPDLLTGFQFEVRGQTFGPANAKLGWLTFDAAGVLKSFGVGSDCKAGVCFAHVGNADSFFVSYDQSTLFGNVGDPQGLTSWGGGTLSVNSAVPEPESWCLMLVGMSFIGVAQAGRRQTRQAVIDA